MNNASKENISVYKKFSSLATMYTRKTAFHYEEEVWTFSDVQNFVNKVANYFKKQGYKKGDCVGLILENCPDYPCIWLGLSKLGVATALINTNLVKHSLAHCIKVANCKAVIFGSNFRQAVEDVVSELDNLVLYDYNRDGIGCMKHTNLKFEISNSSGADFPVYDNIAGNDVLLYIYTSGTTGLPKAAVVTNARYLTFLCFVQAVLSKIDELIIYSPMPLYHASGSSGSVSLTLTGGATTVLKKKFSATSYWKDCAKYKCNMAQYIGEMCRYILSTPYDETIKHNVKYIIGNGLQQSIWKTYVEKFKIEKVYEFYGATEGNIQLVNVDNKIGSVGCIPFWLRSFTPIFLVKYDKATGEAIRDSNGRCIKCDTNEAGLIIGKIDTKVAVNRFTGYLGSEANQNKVLSDVFEVGDQYFNSGDVLFSDELGYFYFKDRLGDTFRWKGENVSTVEVEDVLYKVANFSQISVYGVEIPGTEGRIGMAAIVTNNNSLVNLAKDLKANLPSYAVPAFIRIVDSIPITATFKLKKMELQKEGFNVNAIKDKIYVLKSDEYILLTEEIYNDIINHKLRL
ncbi:hypothetical protein RI129_002149 [Pyrocoelia pectoralis]|uniref:Very long-chain fatty acid transport protein n=1 Tax=Pyrocoelia pectoralis TaxID=417401 RepID=A0AAN7ZLU2_9COLE